jgi:hypothetical protein
MPNASAPAARELVLINSRRSTRERTAVSGAFREDNFSVGFDTCTRIHCPTADALPFKYLSLRPDPSSVLINALVVLSWIFVSMEVTGSFPVRRVCFGERNVIVAVGVASNEYTVGVPEWEMGSFR